MNRYLFSILGIFFLMVTSSCSFTKDITAHKNRLQAALAENISLEEKRDVVAESAIEMMHQAVDKLDPRRGVKFVKAYAKTNGPLIDALVKQIEKEQQDLSDTERIRWSLGVLSKPYAQDAVDLVPRFIKRYKQYQAVAKIGGQLKSLLLGKAAGFLGYEDSYRVKNLVGVHRESSTQGFHPHTHFLLRPLLQTEQRE